MQIQAELGEGHINVIEAKEVLVTHTHLALSLEYAAGGSLTSYVADRWQHSQHSGLFLSEDEARYFFRVRTDTLHCACTVQPTPLCPCMPFQDAKCSFEKVKGQPLMSRTFMIHTTMAQRPSSCSKFYSLFHYVLP